MMAKIGMSMSQMDVASLKEALCAQEQLIEKLYNELDEESEASASAASEALSMILRLQGEKAAEEMEAGQYKRLVEEKMCHAEESIYVLQDLIDEKEMEIADLDYQAQVYRDKLLSMGCDDLDLEIPENLLQTRNENLDGNLSHHGIGRVKSAPDIASKVENVSPGRDLNDNLKDGSISSYCEQIEKLEERVKQITGANNSEMRYRLPHSQGGSTNNFLDAYQVKHRGNKSGNETTGPTPVVGSVSPPNVLDVFEVPRAINTRSPPKHEDNKMIWHSNERHEKPDIAVKPIVNKDETANCLKKCLVPKQQDNKLQRAAEPAASLACNMATVPTNNASETAEMPRHNRTFEIADVERQTTRQEPDRQEELMLLKEIKEQIYMMQSEIRSWKNKKSPPRNEPSLVSLTEVMVCFWL